MKSRLARTLLASTTALMLFASPVVAQQANAPAVDTTKPQYDPNEVLSNLTRGQLDKIIGEYITTHPEVLVQALVISSQQQKAQEAKMTEAAIEANRDMLFHSDLSPVVGNPKGDVAIAVFYDYNCGVCRIYSPYLQQLAQEDKGLKIVFKEYPILSAESEVAAKASVAFYRLNKDKYMDFHMETMKRMKQADLSVMIEVAKAFGVSSTALKNEMESEAVTREIENTRQLGQMLYIDGTPTTVIGSEAIPGPLEPAVLREKIAKLRGK